MNRNRQELDYIVAIPIEFTNRSLDISVMQQTILKEFIIQDNNAEDFETLDELRNKIKYNYNKPISVKYGNMAYEKLEENDLIKEIHYLLLSGLLYINVEQ